MGSIRLISYTSAIRATVKRRRTYPVRRARSVALPMVGRQGRHGNPSDLCRKERARAVPFTGVGKSQASPIGWSAGAGGMDQVTGISCDNGETLTVV
jgi:hypothetical protein